MCDQRDVIVHAVSDQPRIDALGVRHPVSREAGGRRREVNGEGTQVPVDAADHHQWRRHLHARKRADCLELRVGDAAR